MVDENPDKPSVIGSGLGSALMARGEDRQKKLQETGAELQAEMEAAGVRIRDLVLIQPPTELLGYLWSQFYMGVVAYQGERHDDEGEPNKELLQKFQFVLEYVHAVWSSHNDGFAEHELDEGKATELLAECDKLRQTAVFYAMASSQSETTKEFGVASPDMEFHAKSSWVLIRGHRYQVLEREFFEFALAPHDEALIEAYGMGAAEIADGVQSIADTIRIGYSDAIEKLNEYVENSHAIMKAREISSHEALERTGSEEAGITSDIESAFRDMFHGGICNLSRHTKLTDSILEDMSYQPGQEKAFYADGPFKGTPFRTLPARVRPLIRLSDGYYATDGQFVRDSAYRSIQRGVIARLPDYRECWNYNQKVMTETAFPKILSNHMKGARWFEEVYFKDVATGEWVETDLIGLMDDVLVVLEAKAGVMAMQSPATNFESHIRTIRGLVLKAYRQCKRFLDYLASGGFMPIYGLVDGRYVEIAKVNLKSFRCVFPIGLTLEAFTPFSSMCKIIPEVAPILGKHAFISMSVDDLFVIGRFLPSGGELFHYLQVRQAVAGMPRAMMFDEIDHLGAYVVRHRFDQDMRQQLEQADIVAWDSFSNCVDRHFGKDRWKTDAPPRQEYPAVLQQVLDLLDHERPRGWRQVDAAIRDYDEQSRKKLASIIGELAMTLRATGARRFVFGNALAMQIWLTCEQAHPTPAEIQRQGEIASLVVKASRVLVLRLQYNDSGTMLGAQCFQVASPPILRTDYVALVAEADRQRARLAKSGEPKKRRTKR